MLLSSVQKDTANDGPDLPVDSNISLTAQRVKSIHEVEVLAFLSERPIHTVFMAGFIRDNGLVSDLNRGAFYAYRDSKGRLEGVALIGHATLIEARSDAALAAFARVAQDSPAAYLILGEQEKVERFWNHFAQAGRETRMVCRELLLEQRWPSYFFEEVPGLRLATPDDLGVLLPVYAGMIYEESLVNPMEIDPEGFRRRWLRRILQNRVWVWVENGRLIFNADVMSDTPDCIYLEGVYVSPDERGKGYGLRCLSQLGRTLLERTRALCLLLNERNQSTRGFYQKAGYEFNSYYDTIFLQREN
jgi:uncharacterized protein